MGGIGAARVVKLEECAEVLPGFSVPGRIEHDPAGTHQLVLTRHLIEGEPYVYDPSHELRTVPGRDTSRYEVGTGDVVFMSRGSRNLAWAIADVPLPTITPVSFYIIRPWDTVEGEYLAWYLNQAPVQAAIEQARTGAATPIVQRKAFARLEIVLPPVDVQRQISEVGRLMAQERLLVSRLAQALNRAHGAIGQQIIRSLRAPIRAGERNA